MVQCDSCGFLVFRCVGYLILKLSYMLWRRPDSVGFAGAVVRLVALVSAVVHSDITMLKIKQ